MKQFIPSFTRIRFCIVFLALVAVMALVGPGLCTWLGIGPTEINADWPTLPPGLSALKLGHLFGTDDLGRDVFARVAVGAQISLAIGLLTALVSVVFGTLYGMIAAQNEGPVDDWMMRAVDVLYSLPGLMIVILFSVFCGRSVPSLVMALALFSWPDTARMIRSQVLVIKREEFVSAFKSLGGTFPRLLLRYFLPNVAALVTLTATITVPRAILTESTLSFIGLGVEPPLSSWGTLASEGWQLVRVAPHLVLFPTLFIVVTMVALNLTGDALRSRLQPTNRKLTNQ